MHRRTAGRPAFTLVELLAAMAVGSAMMGVAVGVLYMLLGLERDGRQELRYRDTVARLSRQFRDDVHAANGFDDQVSEQETRKGEADAGEPPEPRRNWEFDLPGRRTVRYTWSPEELVRTEHAEGEPVSREGFGLAPDVSVSIEEVVVEHSVLIRLRIVPAEVPGDLPATRETQIDAVFHHDCRLLYSKWVLP